MLKHKSSYNYSLQHALLEKKKFLINCKSERFFLFPFTIFLCVRKSRGTLTEIRTVLDLFQVIPAIFELEVVLGLRSSFS